MKRYRHKPSGKIFEKFQEGTGYEYYCYKPTGECISAVNVVEDIASQDWEEINNRQRIVTLQGFDIFEGQSYWVVMDDWNIEPKIAGGIMYDKTRSFYYRRDAESFVRDNKPVYPIGLIQEAIKLGLMVDFLSSDGINCDNRITVLCKKLKSFNT